MRGAPYRRRFGLPPTAVTPLYAPRPAGVQAAGARALTTAAQPDALVVFDPALGRAGRLWARLGSGRAVTLGVRGRPVAAKGLGWVAVGGVAGMFAAQPFDTVTFTAPLAGLVLGAAAGAAGWRAVRGRGSVTLVVEDWRLELEAVAAVLQNADRLGQPFVSPPALRATLHGALWHAALSQEEAGGRHVRAAFDEQLASLQAATDTALLEIESAAIAARRAAVSERLAAAVEELTLSLPPGAPGPEADTDL